MRRRCYVFLGHGPRNVNRPTAIALMREMPAARKREKPADFAFALRRPGPRRYVSQMASSPDLSLRLPTAADVDAAAERLAGVALRTPLISSPALDARTGGRVFLKAETLQRTGSFKFRGA